MGAMSKAPFVAMRCLVLPPALRPMLEVLTGHTTHLQGTFARVTGDADQRRVAVSLLKQKAQYSARSCAVLGLSMEMASQLSPSKLAKLPPPVLISPATTAPRPIPQLLDSLPKAIRPSEGAVRARVDSLCATVPCVIRSSKDEGELTAAEAKAEYSRIQGLKGELSRDPCKPASLAVTNSVRL
jgi:hypothetical protein